MIWTQKMFEKYALQAHIRGSINWKIEMVAVLNFMLHLHVLTLYFADNFLSIKPLHSTD